MEGDKERRRSDKETREEPSLLDPTSNNEQQIAMTTGGSPWGSICWLGY